jgi:hypothetical protein
MEVLEIIDVESSTVWFKLKGYPRDIFALKYYADRETELVKELHKYGWNDAHALKKLQENFEELKREVFSKVSNKSLAPGLLHKPDFDPFS